MFGIDAMTPADFRRPSRSGLLRGVKLTLGGCSRGVARHNDHRPCAGRLCPFERLRSSHRRNL
jgi:hypothetical protein